MDGFLKLVSRFEGVLGRLKYDFMDSNNSGYFKDIALAQISIIDSILQNPHVHGYKKDGLISFLLNLKAEDFAELKEISNQKEFIEAFDDYIGLMHTEILQNQLEGSPIIYL